MGEGEREQRSDMHGRDAVMAGGEKQGGENKRSRANGRNQLIPTALEAKAVFRGTRLRSQSQRAALGAHALLAP